MSIPKILMWMVLVVIGLTSLTTSVMAFTCHGVNEVFISLLINLLGLVLLAPTVVFLHRPGFRAGGIVLCAVFLIFWTGLLLILFSPDFLNRHSSDMYNTMLVALFMGIPTAVALMNVHQPWGKWFGWIFGTLAAITIPMVLLAIWGPDSESVLWSKIANTGGSAFLILGTGAACLINLGQGDRRYFRWAGVIITLVSMTCVSILIWQEEELWGNSVLKLVAQELWVVAGVFAIINMLLMTWHPGLVRWMQWAAIILTAICGLTFAIAIWRSFAQIERYGFGMEARAVAATGTLAVGAIVSMLVARTMLRLKPKLSAPPGIDRLTLHCPICGTVQSVPLQGACQKCLVEFKIVITEPRCPACEHLVLNLTSERCPECGGVIKRPVALTPPPMQAAELSPPQ